MLVYIVLALLVGGLISVHIAMNAYAGLLSGNPLYANVFFWTVGLVAALIAAAPRSDPGFVQRSAAVPLWLCLAGAIGASISLFTNYAIPKLGLAGLSLLTIFGQLAASSALSHFGLLASPREPLGAQKLAGLGLAAAGAALFLLGGKVPSRP